MFPQNNRYFTSAQFYTLAIRSQENDDIHAYPRVDTRKHAYIDTRKHAYLRVSTHIHTYIQVDKHATDLA